MPLNLRRRGADSLTVPPSGERRLLLGLLLAPVLLLDLVSMVAVAAADPGDRTRPLTVLGLCLVLTLIALGVGPGLVRRSAATGHDRDPVTRGVETGLPVHGFGPPAGSPVEAFSRQPLPAPLLAPQLLAPPVPAHPPVPSGPPASFVICAGRRHQALIARQLDGLDRLAAAPQVGRAVQDEVARLGQLTVRLRRSSESLLVLAGAEPGRRAGAGAPLSAVITAAQEETEQTGRAAISWQADHLVRPQLVVPLTHLLAELMECVGGEAPAEVRVDVRPSPDGLWVQITGSAPAPPPAELDLAVQLLHDPQLQIPVDGIRPGALGFATAVVGRLARELSCTVEIDRTVSGGLEVGVGLAHDTFLPNSASGPGERSVPSQRGVAATTIPETAMPEPADPLPVAESPWFSRPEPQDAVAAGGSTAPTPEPSVVGPSNRPGWATPEDLSGWYDPEYSALRDPLSDPLSDPLRDSPGEPLAAEPGVPRPVAPGGWPDARPSAPSDDVAAPVVTGRRGRRAAATQPDALPVGSGAPVAPAVPRPQWAVPPAASAVPPVDPAVPIRAGVPAPRAADGPTTGARPYPTRAELRRRRRAVELGAGGLDTAGLGVSGAGVAALGRLEAPPIPAQAMAPEDAPTFQEDQHPAGPAYPEQAAQPEQAARSGSDAAASLIGAAAPVPTSVPDGSGRRATHVRSMLADLRAANVPEQAPTESGEQGSVPPPRGPNTDER